MTSNGDIPRPDLIEARKRVLHVQRKLHRWSQQDKAKRYDNLFNLVCDRATLLVAWDKVKSNRGSKTAGVDGVTKSHILHGRGGEQAFLNNLRVGLKDRSYRCTPVRKHGIPKAGGKVRYLGIPTVRDRVVQMALKLVLEPIYEVDFYPSSYGYRPARRAQDAIAEIARFIHPPAPYEWVIEGDIKACFDNVDHGVLVGLLRQRVGDKKVIALLKACLKSGVVNEAGRYASTITGTPQGGIVSPLLANVYLSVLDRYFEQAWQYQTRYIGHSTRLRRQGHPTYRLIRYADDCAPRRRREEVIM